MAKRKRATQMVIFKPEDQIKLLAWLDYTIKHKLPFETTVIDRLLFLCDKEFTLPKVNKKLYSLWHRLGSDDARDKKEIFDKGSACLDGLDDTERDSIRETMAMLEDLSIHRHPSKRRCLRSATRSDSQVSGSLEGLEIAPTSNAETKLKGESKPATPLRPKQEAVAPKPYEERGTVGIEQSKTETQPGTKLIHTDVKRSGDINATEPIPPTRTVIRSSEDENSSTVTNERNSTKERVRHKKARTESRRRDERLSKLPPNLKRLVKSTKRRMRKALIEDQQTQLQRLKGEMNDLQDQVDCHEVARREGSKGEDVIFRQERHIGELEKKLKNRILLGTFTKHSKTHSPRPRATSFEQEMWDIREGVRHILFGYDHQPLIVPRLEVHSELKRILYQSLNLDPKKAIGMESLTWRLSEIDPRALIRAVTALALRDWVFESNFPSFEENVSPVLTMYREHLRTQDGATVLTNLDSAAYNTLIRDTRFRTHIIPRKADKLAKKLSRTLAPFFPSSAPDSAQAAFETWGQDEETWKNRKLRLVDIFETSLKLKADSLLNFERYEMVFVSPGTSFDSSTMDAETMDGGRIDTVDRRARQVTLCLHPSILAYTSQTAKELGLPSMVTVDSKNFIRRDSNERSGATVVTKAVVVLKA